VFIADFWTFLDKDQAFMRKLVAKLEETRLRTYRRGVFFINDPFLEFSINISEYKSPQMMIPRGSRAGLVKLLLSIVLGSRFPKV